MSLIWQRGKLIRRSGRILRPELPDSAASALADRNQRDITRVNRWFRDHRALLRVLKDPAHPRKKFSVLDVGAWSRDMGKPIPRRYRNATVSFDHRSLHLRHALGPRMAADAFTLPFLSNAFDFVVCSSVLHRPRRRRQRSRSSTMIKVKKGDHIRLIITTLDRGHGFKLEAFHVDQKLPTRRS
jgi:hypothetical protein